MHKRPSDLRVATLNHGLNIGVSCLNGLNLLLIDLGLLLCLPKRASHPVELQFSLYAALLELLDLGIERLVLACARASHTITPTT